MTKVIQRLKKVKQIKDLARQLKATAKFFLRFVKREPRFFFYSPSVALAKAKRSAWRKDTIKPTQVNDLLVEGLSFHKDVISYPLKLGNKKDYSGGLVDSTTKTLIEEAIHTREISSQEPPTIVSSASIIPEINHVVLFGGILYDNFGHFLFESLSRLWAYDYVRELDPYIFFYQDMGYANYFERSNFVHQVLAGFNIPHKRIIFIDYVVKFKNMIIPLQKYGYLYCKNPDAVFLKFINSFKFSQLIPKGFESATKIYVSRTKIPFGSGKILGESLFEEYLHSNGYTMFYPEFHSLYEQLTVYTRASKIIFSDGGALHGCILLPKLQAEVAVIARRRDPAWKTEQITDQFLGYGKTVSWIDAIRKQYQFGLESWYAISIVDWYEASKLLKANGFVDAVFDGFDETVHADLVRSEMINHIESIRGNPNFIDFMMRMEEKGLDFPE